MLAGSVDFPASVAVSRQAGKEIGGKRGKEASKEMDVRGCGQRQCARSSEWANRQGTWEKQGANKEMEAWRASLGGKRLQAVGKMQA